MLLLPPLKKNTDIVTLLCLRNARSGGLSSWSSSISVHNEILRRAPHLAQALAGPDWYYDRKGEVRGGQEVGGGVRGHLQGGFGTVEGPVFSNYLTPPPHPCSL